MPRCPQRAIATSPMVVPTVTPMLPNDVNRLLANSGASRGLGAQDQRLAQRIWGRGLN